MRSGGSTCVASHRPRHDNMHPAKSRLLLTSTRRICTALYPTPAREPHTGERHVLGASAARQSRGHFDSAAAGSCICGINRKLADALQIRLQQTSCAYHAILLFAQITLAELTKAYSDAIPHLPEQAPTMLDSVEKVAAELVPNGVERLGDAQGPYSQIPDLAYKKL